MSRVLCCAAVILACTAGAAPAALPRFGTLVPGASLGGVKIGDNAARVQALLGRFYGACRGCATPTWYFTYQAFDQKGLAVEFTRGRVSAVYTLWQPPGWRGPQGLGLGAVEGEVVNLAGPLLTLTCNGYIAMVRDGDATRTAYYIVDGKLWGFGLLRKNQTPCR